VKKFSKNLERFGFGKDKRVSHYNQMGFSGQIKENMSFLADMVIEDTFDAGQTCASA